MVARRAHNPKVVCSIHTSATILYQFIFIVASANVAQLVRARDSYPRGRWFEPTHWHHKKSQSHSSEWDFIFYFFLYEWARIEFQRSDLSHFEERERRVADGGATEPTHWHHKTTYKNSLKGEFFICVFSYFRVKCKGL